MNKAILRCSRQNGKARKTKNYSRNETRLVIRPFTVKVNYQIRGLASIRKGLGKENTPFLVSTNSIIASENVSERVLGANFESLKRVIFINPEGSQSRGVPIRRGPNFCQSGEVLILPIRRSPVFCQSGGVLNLPIRRGPKFANLEGSCFCQSGGVLFLPIRRGLVFANPEGHYFC